MKTVLNWMIAIICLFSSVLVHAGLEEGLEAYDKNDYVTAMRELKPFAIQGNARAQHKVGLMYHFGEGTPKDTKEGIKWLRLSADQGEAIAQHFMGVIYKRGIGLPQSNKEAIKWFKRAAEQGFAAAQNFLGHELHGSQDYEEAL